MKKKKNLSAKCVKAIRKMMDAVNHAKGKRYNQENFPSCGETCSTEFCAAGFAVLANNPKRFTTLVERTRLDSVDWQEEAAKALHLPADTDLSSLFMSAGSWPGEIGNHYEEDMPLKDRVHLFNLRWEAFLASDGLI